MQLAGWPTRSFSRACLAALTAVFHSSFATSIPAAAPPLQLGAVQADESKFDLPPLKRDASKLPSELAFKALNLSDSDDGRADALVRVRALCEAFPNSAAAGRCHFMLKDWLTRRFITEDAIAPFRKIADAANPARDQLAAAELAVQQSVKQNDQAAMSTSIDVLENIRDQHPGTISSYLAIANLGPAYHRKGERKLALRSAQRFLSEYPPATCDYPSYDGYLYNNLFLLATTAGSGDSVDSALEIYSRIAEAYSDNIVFAVPALNDAASLAFSSKRYEAARQLYDKLAVSFPEDADSRIVLARFRAVESLMASANYPAALDAAVDLNHHLKGTNWAPQADQFLDWVLTETGNQPKAKVEPVPRQSLNAAGADSKSTLMEWLLAGNIVVVSLAIAAYGFRRFRQRKGQGVA